MFSHSELFLREDGIVQINFKDETNISIEESIEINTAIGKLTSEKEALVLMIAGEQTDFDEKARAFSASVLGLKYTIADALVVKNLAQKLMGNFYLNFNRPKKPSRIFTSSEDATKWLLSLKV